MTDFTVQTVVTAPRPTHIHSERCAQCHCQIVGGRKRKYCEPSCRKDAKADRARNHVLTAKEIDYQRDYQLTYRQTANGIRAQHRSQRKNRLNGTQGYRTREVYLAAMRRTYRKRRKRQLMYMRERQTKYVGTGLKPVCITCGERVLWSGRGRPRDCCPTHDTLGRRRRITLV